MFRLLACSHLLACSPAHRLVLFSVVLRPCPPRLAVHFSGELSWFTVQSLQISSAMTLTLGTGLSVAVEASWAKKYVNPWRISWMRLNMSPIKALIGVIPVYVPYGFGADLTPSFKVRCGFSRVIVKVTNGGSSVTLFEPLHDSSDLHQAHCQNDG